MDKDKRKILILVEGEKTDLKLMEKLLHIYGIDKRHQVVSYNTNIYALYNTMFRDADPDDLDILQHLKEHEKDPSKKAIFDERFSDVLLVFDLDPHDPQYSSEKILAMASFFVESSDMGKLYLNYPMIEAFYHMKSIPDPDYKNYIVTMNELKDGTYKSRVNAENRNHDYTKFAVDKNESDIVISQNLEKARNIVDSSEFVPVTMDILKAQLYMIEQQEVLHILCTCAFYIPDYNPNLITNA